MKKLAVFLLTGLTCASMLFGCGSKNDTVETVPVAEVQESTAAPAETEFSRGGAVDGEPGGYGGRRKIQGRGFSSTA